MIPCVDEGGVMIRIATSFFLDGNGSRFPKALLHLHELDERRVGAVGVVESHRRGAASVLAVDRRLVSRKQHRSRAAARRAVAERSAEVLVLLHDGRVEVAVDDAVLAALAQLEDRELEHEEQRNRDEHDQQREHDDVLAVAVVVELLLRRLVGLPRPVGLVDMRLEPPHQREVEALDADDHRDHDLREDRVLAHRVREEVAAVAVEATVPARHKRTHTIHTPLPRDKETQTKRPLNDQNANQPSRATTTPDDPAADHSTATTPYNHRFARPCQ